MKLFLIAALVLYSIAAIAQPVLVPYKTGNKFGLSDLKGKMIVSPAYDEIMWQQDQYFITKNELTIKDSSKKGDGTFIIHDQKIILQGILYKNREIIKNSPYDVFDVMPGKCILGQNNNRRYNMTNPVIIKDDKRGKFFSLFDLNGKNIYPQDFKRLQKIDTTGISSKNKKNARYILFGAENFDGRSGLFVFDTDKQEISGWLLKNMNDISVTHSSRSEKLFSFSYKDENYTLQHKTINYNSGKFILSDNVVPKKDPADLIVVDGGSGTSDARLEENVKIPVEENVYNNNIISFDPYFQLIRDSLFWITGSEKDQRSFINVPTDMHLIFKDEKTKFQRGALLFKQKDEFGWLYPNRVMMDMYDSLVYFNDGFISAKKINGSLQYKLLNSVGGDITLETFDSIQVVMKQYETGDLVINSKLTIVLKEKRAYGNAGIFRKPYQRESSDNIIVYINGRAGMMSRAGEIIIPVAYDTIAENGLSFSRPNNSSFFILKNNGLYGLTNVKYNDILKKYEAFNTIEPIFTKLPAFTVKDYFGVKGLTMIGLYDTDAVFCGYADEKGKLYSSEK